jgi:hypothetical protein
MVICIHGQGKSPQNKMEALKMKKQILSIEDYERKIAILEQMKSFIDCDKRFDEINAEIERCEEQIELLGGAIV